MAVGGKRPRLFHAAYQYRKRKYSIASWSFWVQKHVWVIKIDTSDALSSHLCQIYKNNFLEKKKRDLK